MTQGSYKQFCPIAMASEILCTRWTIILLRELVTGVTRFNDLRRGAPRMSPALLSQRLKDLEEAGIVTRQRGRGGVQEYHLTDSGRELEPIVMAVGAWGQRWIEKDLSLQHLDAQLLMWDMRRNLNADPLPSRRSVIHFQYADAPAMQRKWWLVVEANGEVDLCSVDPGFDVDLYASCDLRTMTAIWMGYDTVKRALSSDALLLTGDAKIAKNMQAWLGLSPLAKVERMAS
ncbi:MAG TPA: helix-turn-helix domain-containing protein [Verrucomicrobiae bacterium]|nr:helix-turn-helix domain-containing protein [Verrucomicrobiae bacterium]